MSVHKIVLNGHDIVMTDTGNPGERTFLLVHGIGMGSSYFAQLSAVLEKHGRVVAIDLPGFGDTSEPAKALPMAETGALLVDFVLAQQLLRPVLVGHSMGTQVVVEAAAQRPALFPDIVLVAPTVNRYERTIGKQVWRMLQDLYGESPKVLAIGLHNYAKTGPRWFIKKLRRMMEHSVEDVLPLIRSRTLVIRGSRDRICPQDWVAEVTAMIPGARMVVVEGRGHETMVKDGESVATHIMAHVGIRCAE